MPYKDNSAKSHDDLRIRSLLEYCPFLESHVDLGEHAYYIMGEIAVLLRNDVFSDKEVEHIIEHFHAMARSEADTQNLLVVGALELLADTPESIRWTRQKLRSGPAAFLYERVLKGWGSKTK